jgi:hypothetical protein
MNLSQGRVYQSKMHSLWDAGDITLTLGSSDRLRALIQDPLAPLEEGTLPH